MASTSSDDTSGWEEQIQFKALSDFFEVVSKQTVKKNKLVKLEKFLADCRSIAEKPPNSASTPGSLYPIMRLMLPKVDSERGAYGIKETVLARLYIDMLHLGPLSPDAQKLREYRAPKANQSDAGDFAAVLYSVIKMRSDNADRLTVKQVNEKLDEIVVANATKGREGVVRILMELFKKMSNISQKWLVRIILKDMKLGIGQDSIMKKFHVDCAKVYDVNANIRKVCLILRNPKKSWNEMQVSLNTPFRPMLADRDGFNAVDKRFSGRKFFIEVKYDGERLQIHKKKDDYQFFSRNSNDFSADFGTQQGGGSWRSAHDENDELFQQCFYAYDIVYLNGDVLTNKPLRERLHLLKDVLVEKPGRVHFSQLTEGASKQDAVNALNDAIDRREEGIMLKDPESVYNPGSRNAGWFKLKPEYEDSLSDECDLIVLGGYYGSGRRGAGDITHFLLGILSPDNLEFHSFCRVGSGYSMKELFDLLKKLKPKFIPKAATSSAGYVRMDKFGIYLGKERPDVLLAPKDSVLLQVKAAEIVNSDVYKTNCTLRFPRVEKVRYDKSWSECMTVSQLDALREAGKLTKKHLSLRDLDADGQDESTQRKRKRGDRSEWASQSQAVSVGQQYRGIDPSRIMVETHDLKDKVLVVEPSNAELKARLEAIILKFGGIVEQNVRKGRTYCYVETGLKLRAKNVIKDGNYDVVRSNWLLHCDRAGFRPLRPSDLVHTTPQTKALFGGDYDPFGDPFFQLATEDSLRFSMNRVKELRKDASLTREEIAIFEHEYMDKRPKLGLFRELTFYIDRYASVGEADTALHHHNLKASELQLLFYGGQVVVDYEMEGVTHVVTSTKDSERLRVLRRLRTKKLGKKFHIVTEDWVEKCLEQNLILEGRHFEPDM